MRALLFCLVALWGACTAPANPLLVLGGSPPTAGACNVARFSATGASVDEAQIGSFANLSYRGHLIAFSGDHSICAIDVQLLATGSPTGNVRVGIYSDTGGSGPGTQVGGWSGNLDASTLTASYATYSFTIASPATLTTANYWVVVHFDNGNSSNYVRWSHVAFTGSESWTGSDGATWLDDAGVGARAPYVVLYSQ